MEISVHPLSVQEILDKVQLYFFPGLKKLYKCRTLYLSIVQSIEEELDKDVALSAQVLTIVTGLDPGFDDPAVNEGRQAHSTLLRAGRFLLLLPCWLQPGSGVVSVLALGADLVRPLFVAA